MPEIIQEQVLGMKWLNTLIDRILTAVGVDTGSRVGGSISFFLYDVIKILFLLCVMLFVIAFVQSYFPPSRSRRIMARFHGLGANTVGALLGTVTPFCSCSSIPIFIGFTRAGLPMGVTFSFLISSPLVDLGSLVLLMSVFGLRVAVAYVVLGLVIAIAGGTLIERLHMEDQLVDFLRERRCCADTEARKLTIRERLKSSRDSMLSNLRKLLPYVIAGVAIGAVIHNWIPERWVVSTLGNHNPLGVILATIAGIPMYADIFSTVPIAEALLGKGALLGTILAMMMAVTTLSLPSLIMLNKVIKPKLMAAFIAICTAGIIIVGYTFNLLEKLFD